MSPVLRVEAAERRLGRVTVLHAVDLTVGEGRLVALAGRSGSGKSTLCHLAAGVEPPTEGRVLVDGRPATEVADWSVLSLLPQRLALVEELTVAENVRLPLLLCGDTDGAGRVDELTRLLALEPLAGRSVTQTSLGEQQRTALARALVLGPRLAVLDEPTSHQDDERVGLVLDALAAARAGGTALLVATHDERVLAVADEIVELHDGEVVG
jgi:ABC-type lipoprotein export system ATPase subunit